VAWHVHKGLCSKWSERGFETLAKRKVAPEVISTDMKTFNQLLLMAGMPLY